MRFCLLVVGLDRAFDEAFERPTRRFRRHPKISQDGHKVHIHVGVKQPHEPAFPI